MSLGSLHIVAQSLDVQADREALVRNGNVNQRGSQNAVEHRIRMVERSRLTREPVEKLLVLVERSECRPLAPENVDIAREAYRGVLRNLVKLQT